MSYKEYKVTPINGTNDAIQYTIHVTNTGNSYISENDLDKLNNLSGIYPFFETHLVEVSSNSIPFYKLHSFERRFIADTPESAVLAYAEWVQNRIQIFKPWYENELIKLHKRWMSPFARWSDNFFSDYSLSNFDTYVHSRLFYARHFMKKLISEYEKYIGPYNDVEPSKKYT